MIDPLSAPVAALIDAANAGDTDDFLDGFTVNGYVDDWGRVFTGREEIRRWSDDEFIGADVSLEVVSHTRSGDVVTVEAEVGGSGFNGPSHFDFEVDGDLVGSMTITE